MRAYPKFAAFAAVLTASGVASAQSSDAQTSAPSSNAYPTYPGERHVIVRAIGGEGIRLSDPFASGILLPPYALVQGGYLFLNAGPVHMGPTVGVQAGFDPRSTVQWAAQPGWAAMYRVSPLVALTARVDVPFLFTRGVSNTTMLPGLDPTQPPIYAPTGRRTDVGLGIEAGVGAAFYLTSGFALTAELNGGVYFGELASLPYLSLGAGVLFDYEILP